MPEIGEIRKGYQIRKNRFDSYIYHVCIDCGNPRWVHLVGGKPISLRCKSCAGKLVGKANFGEARCGEKSSNWRGGEHKTKSGYIETKLQPNDFFYPMVDIRGYVRKHRLILAKHLKRCLLSWEIVHHKNGIKDDNRIENLELLPSRKYHVVDTVIKSRISKLERRVALLEAENVLLRQQIENSKRIKI